MELEKSTKLFSKAQELFPGGVNSPVRAFKAVGGTPLFMRKGQGCYVYDEDDNAYIDFCCSFGPLILGHAHEKVVKAVCDTASNGTTFGAPTAKENKLASLILENNPYLERIRFVNSGTEAVMSGIRLARGYTGRNKIIKFEGCYHGHVDPLLVKAGSGLVTFGTSSSAGVPENVVEDTIVLPLNDEEALREALTMHGEDVACVIIEPIPANNGLLIQHSSFLKLLRELTKAHGILLFFDEVISGFRVGFTGAAGHFDIQPDIVSYGKIIGGGLPVGAYGGKKEIMEHVAPLGDVYQAGTLSGNPVAMAAGIAQIKEALRPGFYEDLEERTQSFVKQIMDHVEAKGYDFYMYSIGSIFWFSFGSREIIRNASDISSEGVTRFTEFFHKLLNNGVYIGPSGYEVGFISQAHKPEALETAAQKINTCLDEVFA